MYILQVLASVCVRGWGIARTVFINIKKAK